MAGSRSSVKSNCRQGEIANFSLGERETFLPGTGFENTGEWSVEFGGHDGCCRTGNLARYSETAKKGFAI